MHQIDLALFLRLSRSLERTRSAGQVPLEEHAAILRALDGVLLAVEERSEWLRTREVVQPAPAVELQVEEIAQPPAQPAESAPAMVPEQDQAQVEVQFEGEEDPQVAPQVWTRQHDLLYEDVLWLFKVGDNEGALISLGRLLLVAYDTPELQRFIEINQKKLVGLYERMMGSFNRPYSVNGNGLGDRYFWNAENAEAIYTMLRQKRTVGQVLDESPLPRLQTLSLVHRLHVERVIGFQEDSQKAI